MKGLVLAGNYKQFCDWLKENRCNRQDYKYIDNPTSWRGFHNIPIIKTGTFYEREDFTQKDVEYMEQMVNPSKGEKP